MRMCLPEHFQCWVSQHASLSVRHGLSVQPRLAWKSSFCGTQPTECWNYKHELPFLAFFFLSLFFLNGQRKNFKILETCYMLLTYRLITSCLLDTWLGTSIEPVLACREVYKLLLYFLHWNFSWPPVILIYFNDLTWMSCKSLLLAS